MEEMAMANNIRIQLPDLYTAAGWYRISRNNKIDFFQMHNESTNDSENKSKFVFDVRDAERKKQIEEISIKITERVTSFLITHTFYVLHIFAFCSRGKPTNQTATTTTIK